MKDSATDSATGQVVRRSSANPPRGLGWRLLVVTAVAVLLAAACGQRAEVEDTGGDALGGESGSQSATGSDSDMFGSLPTPCGPTPEGMVLEATDQGITADTIEVATLADPGGAVPGLNQGIFDSMNAFAEWCNDQGGINGRELVVTTLDAALFSYREKVLEACDFAFALVGGGGTFDQLGTQDAIDCGLVNVPGFTVSPEASEAERMYQPQPNPVDTYGVGPARWIAEQDPDAITKAASLFTNTETTELQAEKHRAGYEEVGFEFVYQAAANINESNWAPTVVAMRNAGVEYVTLVSSWEEGVNLQNAMLEQGFSPQFVDQEANYYNADYPAAVGEAGEGTLVRITINPFEEADENPATQQYLDALRATNGDDVVPELLGVQSWSAGLLFATAVKNLGTDVTRDALLEELATVDSWDGGGLHGVTNPAENEPAGCFLLMELRDGAFARLYPDEGLDCSEENLVTVED